MATTRAALASTGAVATAVPVSASVSTSIAVLLQRLLSTVFLAKVVLVASAALACGVAVVLVFLALAGPRAPEIEPHSRKVPTPGANTPIVSTTNLKSIPETDRGIPETQSAILGAENQSPIVAAPERRLSAFGEQVTRAINEGVRFLKSQQKPDGSWSDVENEAKTGTTSLITLALLTAGEKVESPTIHRALDYLRGYGPSDLKSTYAIALQTMVFAAAQPGLDQLRIANNVAWLERAQINRSDRVKWPGSWTYSDLKRIRPGDNSNTQYALLGLHAASEAGVPVKPAVWELASAYWERSQTQNVGWAYTPDSTNQTASMTCAGISSLIITGVRLVQGQEFLEGETIQNCGKGGMNSKLQAGINWLAEHFQVSQNFGNGQQWKFYYLCGLERAGRLTGQRFFGRNDWYRLGAEELVHEQDKLGGFWMGALIEKDMVLATSFALLFLAKGRAPVLINKLVHGPSGDWNNDADDIRNIVNTVSRDWKSLLGWQMVDSKKATVPDLLRAPILFINGHEALEFTLAEKKNLRDYVDRGGFIFAEDCCGRADFDRGFKALMGELFVEKQEQLRPLVDDHPIWRARHLLSSAIHPLWGISRRGRTVVVYSPSDLSCHWNQSGRSPANPAVIKANRVGHNVIDYATGRALPPDRLSDP